MIFALTNQKGGVGKTTSVINLGTYLAVAGNKVLLVDIDPQSNMTSGLGMGGSESSIYDYLVGGEEIETLVQKTKVPNLSIIPSSIELAGAEVELVSTLSRESILKRGLSKIQDDYDFVLIDCPPSLGILTINGLVAADRIIIPVQAEYFALEGLGQLVNTIQLVKNSVNPALEIGGVIVTMFDARTNLSRDVESELKKFFDDKLFSAMVPRNIKLSEAPSNGMTIHEYAPNSAGAVAYKMLADEIITKFGKSSELKRPKLSKEKDS